MYKTVSLKLHLDVGQRESLRQVQSAYADACNQLVPFVLKHRTWNRVKLHNQSYRAIRSRSRLGSQMVSNAIFNVCKAYRSQKELGRIRKDKEIPKLQFSKASVHYDKRTYTLKEQGLTHQLSLATLSKRIQVNYSLGEHQRKILSSGEPKEAELIHRGKHRYFNLVVELADVVKAKSEVIMGVDVGENNLAATITGKIFGGGELRESRDRYLAYRRRLQTNGSQSARQKLCKVSGKERRRVTHKNHETSKAIIQEALQAGVGLIVLEDLTHIRTNIKAGKRVRTRLHRWGFRQLQCFVDYKAKALGIEVLYVDPAYTSQTCSECLALGKRIKHLFTCTCGFRAHADCNASQNLARIGKTAVLSRADVSRPNVGVVH